jgi:hypothetical protein
MFQVFSPIGGVIWSMIILTKRSIFLKLQPFVMVLSTIDLFRAIRGPLSCARVEHVETFLLL